MSEVIEIGNWKAHWTIHKYVDEIALRADSPYEVLEVPANLLLNTGIAALLTLLIGGGGTAFDNSNAKLGVGDSLTAAAAGQTGLQASSNKLYKAMDATYPSLAAQTLTFKSTFAAAEAVYDWNEFCLNNGATNESTGVRLNRKVQASGTKANGPVWTLTLTVTIA